MCVSSLTNVVHVGSPDLSLADLSEGFLTCSNYGMFMCVVHCAAWASHERLKYEPSWKTLAGIPGPI